MKKYSLIIQILSLACACMISAGCASQPAASASAPPPPPNSARLVVDRIANFGTWAILDLSVDGKRVATIGEGRNYSGYLSPGQHTLFVTIEPAGNGVVPFRKNLTVQAGQTYSYTAAWEGTNLVLNRNQ